ncbi:NADP-dependent oxidoreductase [Actinomyces trachealis]|uniref:NADP-dependent oxidoreductase n=1 Tax=Actinomyces trachealis TaxID=2763540 RepID=UPI0018C4AC55|nr:NADP-dependent oxidoreductase [Actinomyces trachealis]
MKAARLNAYDKKNLALKIEEIEPPRIRPDQVLVKVAAAGVNPVDNMITRGEVKMIVSYSTPLTAGNELVGRVEEVGSEVRSFTVGDRVFGRLPLDAIGAFAEYAAVDADALATVPDYLSDEQAAAIPLTALTVMQALELMGAQAPGTIFISGGTGGVGAMAIPIAKARGLTVITNGSASNEQRVLDLGADRFIDYKTEDYAQSLSGIDYVLDTLGGGETRRQMTILKPGGHIVSLKGVPNMAFARRMGAPGWKRFLFGLVGAGMDRAARQLGVTYHFIYVESNGAQLQEAADLLAQQRIVPSIDAVFPFEDVNAALDKVANGRSRGKTVLSMREEAR